MNTQIGTLRERCVRTPLLALLVAAAAALAACDGANLFPTEPGVDPNPPAGGGGTTPTTGPSARDSVPPTLSFLAPVRNAIVLAGDTVGARIRVTDDRALRALEIAAFGVRGDAQLGTLETVERYRPWTVELGDAGRTITDTTIVRVLRATEVADAEPLAFLVATARDTAGNVRADTLRFAIAAPRVEIASPSTGTQVPAGSALRVRIVAEDRVDRVRTIRLVSLGAVTRDTTITFAAPQTSVDTVISMNIPAPTQGQVQLGVEIGTTSGFRKEAAPVAVSLGDAVPPTVRIEAPTYAFRAAVGDSVRVQVRTGDNFGLQSLEISGFSVRGNPGLGTAQTVARFATRTVALNGAAPGRDTVLTRFLLATDDTVPEAAVYVVATARDLAGNVRADTSVIMLARPRIEVTRPSVGARLPAGTPMWIRVHATDAIDRIDSVYVRASGVVSQQFALDVNALAQYVDSVAVQVPADREGEVRIEAEVKSVSGFRRTAAPVTVSVGDVTNPTAVFRQPAQRAVVAVGDSVFVEVALGDNRALASVELSGYSLRGSAGLGTQQRIERFAAKTVVFDPSAAPVTQQTVQRYLLATADTLAEDPVFLLARVRDRAGNVDSATVRIAVGGPRAQILAPSAGQEFRAGTQLQVRGVGLDRNSQIRSLVLRMTGVIEDSVVFNLASAVDSVQHLFVTSIPADRDGNLNLSVIAENRSGVRSASREVSVRVVPPVGDNTPPVVRFTTTVPRRVERTDSIQIAVSATDDTQVDSVGAVVRSYRVDGATRTLMQSLVVSAAAASSTFRIAAADLIAGAQALPLPLVVEVTGFAVDTARNCSYATVPARDSNTRCRTDAGGQRVFTDAGATEESLITPGRTITLGNPNDRIADLVSDGQRVYLSNFSRNRVELLDLQTQQFLSPVNVGSEPWGLALNPLRNTLYVANSGGTNISVLPLTGPSALQESRIQTADIRLYDITYDVLTDTVSSILDLDFSDRPQFLAQTASGRIVYSTRPTSTRADGTVRIFDPSRHDRIAFNSGSEIFTGYADRQRGKATLVNALGVALRPGGRILVQPRPLPHSGPALAPILGTVAEVDSILRVMESAGQTDTRLEDRDASTVGLSDTTFVAVSGDHRSVAFGEGAVNPGRIMLFEELTIPGGGTWLEGSTTQTRDLIGNAAERVVGLSLNADGRLGVARGNQTYFFDNTLRLQGTVSSGSPSGGVSLHPGHSGNGAASPNRRAFVSGHEDGRPYIEEVDPWTFRTLRRFYVRDEVTGSLIAVVVNGELNLFALTSRGVLRLMVDG
jgi:hypothetical protein